MKIHYPHMNDRAVSPVIGVMLMLVVTIVVAAVVSGLASDMGGLDGKTGPNVILDSRMDLESSGITVLYELVTSDPEMWWLPPPEPAGFATQTLDIPTGGPRDPHGLIFTSLGGDAFDLKDLQMSVSSNNLAAQIDYNSIRDQVPSSLPTLSTVVGGNIVASVTVLTPGYSEADVRNLLAALTLEDYQEYITSMDRYFVKIDPETADDTIIRPGDQFQFITDPPSGLTGLGAKEWTIKCKNDGVTAGFRMERGSGSEWVLSHKPSGAVLAKGAFEFPDT